MSKAFDEVNHAGLWLNFSNVIFLDVLCLYLQTGIAKCLYVSSGAVVFPRCL